MKKWHLDSNFQFPALPAGRSIFNFQKDRLIKALLENRGIKTKKEVEEFLNPDIKHVTTDSVGINKTHLKKALLRIQEAIEQKEHVVVFGDYDVDGICGTAILWETLYALGANVTPYIPHRVDEGYGLSEKGISNVKSQIPNIKLIITVDNGIVANEAVEFANKEGIDVIITDHHVPSKKLPKAYSIVHTTKLCGAGVAWMLSRVIPDSFQDPNKKKMLNQVQHDNLKKDEHLELVALATIADLVPLTGANRVLTKFGLEALRKTKRVGLLELFKEAAINQSELGVYQVGHMIAPRLNAMGRLEYAMDSLRLLCTKNKERAKKLAHLLGSTNRERQVVTMETAQHAISTINSQQINKLLFLAHESYQPGVIGLVAGKLVEEFYRPSIVVAMGKHLSKASARSVSGFNMIEFIRMASEFLVDAGGHPMAAGFTVETAKLTLLQKKLEDLAHDLLDEDKLTRTIRIDCELPLLCIDALLYKELQTLSPFGMGNPEPTFVSKNVVIDDMRIIGRDGKHLKLKLQQSTNQQINKSTNLFNAIAFGMGERSSEFRIGDTVDIAYTIDENRWNGSVNLQLKVKDIKKTY